MKFPRGTLFKVGVKKIPSKGRQNCNYRMFNQILEIEQQQQG